MQRPFGRLKVTWGGGRTKARFHATPYCHPEPQVKGLITKLGYNRTKGIGHRLP